MVSSVNRSAKSASISNNRRQTQKNAIAETETKAEVSFLNAIALQLEQIPLERRKEYFTQAIITEILDGKLGSRVGNEPEHARMLNAIKTILLESKD